MTQKEGSSVEANINSELTPEQEAKLDHIVDILQDVLTMTQGEKWAFPWMIQKRLEILSRGYLHLEKLARRL